MDKRTASQSGQKLQADLLEDKYLDAARGRQMFLDNSCVVRGIVVAQVGGMGSNLFNKRKGVSQ
jgi:hypothetical protein